ncbi:hypothetical protein E2320_015897, partial [Naja naja]
IGSDSCTRNCTADPSVSKAPVLQQPQQLRRENPSLSQQSLLSSSAPSSLEEIWQMLEMGSSPSVLSPKNIDQGGEGCFVQGDVFKGLVSGVIIFILTAHGEEILF